MQVIELFLANDETRYLELEFSPRGRYQVLMLSDVRKDAIHTLPLLPGDHAAAVEVYNPCIQDEELAAQEVKKRSFKRHNMSMIQCYWKEICTSQHRILRWCKFGLR